MAILQALRPKTLTRSIVFAGLCLIVAGAAVLVWMLQFIDTDVANPAIMYTRENGGQTIASSSATVSTPNTVGRQNSVTELDPATQAHIRKIVAAADAEQSYQVKTLDNDYFVAHNDVTDGGQELTGYFKNTGTFRKSPIASDCPSVCKDTWHHFDRGNWCTSLRKRTIIPLRMKALITRKLSPCLAANIFF